MSNFERLKIENAKIIFRNFSGKPDKYNKDGTKTFCVVLDEPTALKLKTEGWNVKPLTKRDEDEDQNYILQVKVKFNNYPPVVKMLSGKKLTILDEDSINVLDTVDIETVDVAISPYTYETDDGGTAISAYLKTMYVTIAVDDFADKYQKYEDDIASSDDSMPFL